MAGFSPFGANGLPMPLPPLPFLLPVPILLVGLVAVDGCMAPALSVVIAQPSTIGVLNSQTCPSQSVSNSIRSSNALLNCELHSPM